MELLQRELSVRDFVRDCVDIAKFEACCQLCPNYGQRWSCPPFDFSAAELWTHYEKLILQCRVIPVPQELQAKVLCQEDLNRQSRELLQPYKRAMLAEMQALEKQLPDSLALDAGSCDHCVGCTRAAGLPCIRPNQLRYSVEALGGDVCKALKLYFDKDILWGENGHMPPYFLLLGGLLLR